jgi:hypothetical protein
MPPMLRLVLAMSAVSTAIVLLAFTLGISEPLTAFRKGVPGRRVGGGTRYAVILRSSLPVPPTFAGHATATRTQLRDFISS